MILRLLAGLLALTAFAVRASGASGPFDSLFCDSTLRVDFILSGSCGSVPAIALSEMSFYEGWGGRRINLDRAVWDGNAQAVVTSARGDTMYVQPFSTLFQEWLTTGDTLAPRAMEGTVLLPWPRRPGRISINLFDNRRQPLAGASIAFDPDDILIRDNTAAQPLPHTFIYKGEAPDTAKISVAILAEGYTADEMPLFLDKAREAVDAIFDHEPFGELASRFDFIAVETPSAQSGVSVPQENKWLDTSFGSHFSTFNSPRYLTSPRVHDLYDALTSLPAQHIIVLANTPGYGGGGIFNFYTLTSAGCEQFRPVVVHEFGHSFAGLGDEYFYEDEDVADATYPLDVEPWEPNITTQVDFASKWPGLIKSGEASLVEGGGYLSKGIWRGTSDCRMRTNTASGFCPVCSMAIRRVVEWLTEE